MNHSRKWAAMAIFAFALSVTSCSDGNADPKEEIEIKTMDSTTKVVNENRKNLDDQTKKVEESLEKLDSKFDSTN